MRLDLALMQDIGKRSEQQDSVSARVLPGDSGGVMLIVADGLGGHVGGATASRLAVEAFTAATDRAVFNEAASRKAALAEALLSANGRITEAARNVGPKETMGTTCVAAVVADGGVRWISVGDSHLYLWRAGKLEKLNADHSQAGLMVASGRYKPEDPELNPYRSLLRSALTGRTIELIDDPAEDVQLKLGDVLLLASDGINTIENAEIANLVSKGAGHAADLLAGDLIARVKAAGHPGQDNTSVLVARVTDVDPVTVRMPQPTHVTADPEVDRHTAVITTPILNQADLETAPMPDDDGAPPKRSKRAAILALSGAALLGAGYLFYTNIVVGGVRSAPSPGVSGPGVSGPNASGSAPTQPIAVQPPQQQAPTQTPAAPGPQQNPAGGALQAPQPGGQQGALPPLAPSGRAILQEVTPAPAQLAPNAPTNGQPPVLHKQQQPARIPEPTPAPPPQRQRLP